MSVQDRGIRRGDIYYADLNPSVGSEQGGIRPVLIIQNNIGNRYSPTLIVAAITSCNEKTRLPTHVPVGSTIGRLYKGATVLLEQMRTIDRTRLRERLGALESSDMEAVNNALEVSVGLK